MPEYTPRLVHLPGTAVTPQLVLHRTLDKLARIKSVVIVIQWDDCGFATDWSQMKVSELCMATYALDEDVRKVYRGF